MDKWTDNRDIHANNHNSCTFDGKQKDLIN